MATVTVRTEHEQKPRETTAKAGGGGGGGHGGGGPGGDTRRFTIDLDSAVELTIPQPEDDLCPAGFTVETRKGWTVRIPERRPLATPAYADGRLFVGGGYGSYAFYALDAVTGELIWQMRTSDDGPTAAVVEDGLVAFNTESCSIIVCRAATGELVWEEWLGDPLMAQPAVDQGRLYMAYPTGQRKPDKPGAAAGTGTGHAMLCVELATGRHIWEQPISGDVISAPVVDEGRVYATCLDGSSYCFEAGDGSPVWHERNRGTSAPLIVGGRMIVTEKQHGADDGDPTRRGGEPWERLRRRHSGSGAAYIESMMAIKAAHYLRRAKGGGSPVSGKHSADLDGLVGFSSPPSSAKLAACVEHLGISSVAGAWAYQGSRPAHAHGRIFNAQGRFVQCVEDVADEGGVTGEPIWEGRAQGGGIEDDDQVFLPPALGRSASVYLAGLRGHVLGCSQANGTIESLWHTKRGLAAQPCLAGGSIYLGTVHGELICLPTGSDDADGWTMWGGNGRHNA